MPNLRNLSFENNKIISLMAFAKCYFPELKRSDIRDNPINRTELTKLASI
jgi:hypothetical protein